MSFGRRDSGQAARPSPAHANPALVMKPRGPEPKATAPEPSLIDLLVDHRVLRRWYELSHTQRLIVLVSGFIVSLFIVGKFVHFLFYWTPTRAQPQDLHQIQSKDEFAVILPVQGANAKRNADLRTRCLAMAAQSHGASLRNPAFSNQRIADDPQSGRTVLGFAAGTRFLTCLAMHDLPRFCEPAEREQFAGMLKTYLGTQERVMKEDRVAAQMDAFASFAMRQLAVQGYLRPADFGAGHVPALLLPHLVAATTGQCKT